MREILHAITASVAALITDFVAKCDNFPDFILNNHSPKSLCRVVLRTLSRYDVPVRSPSLLESRLDVASVYVRSLELVRVFKELL